MTVKTLIKQPWFLALSAIILLIVVVSSAFMIGISRGKAQAGVEFNKRQNELLLKSQIAMAEADRQKQLADSNLAYAAQLKIQAQNSTAKAEANETRITEVYEQEQKELKEKYEADKLFIQSDLSPCDRCRDLCRRSNALTVYGPEFASAKCDPSVDCADSCSP